jgi:hypothetical protein
VHACAAYAARICGPHARILKPPDAGNADDRYFAHFAKVDPNYGTSFSYFLETSVRKPLF